MSIVYGAFADEYDKSLEGQIEGLLKNKIYNLEIRFIDGVNISNLSTDDINSTYGKLQKNNINVFAIGSPIGKIDVSENFDTHIELFEKICKFSKILNSEYIRMFSFYNKTNIQEDKYREIVLDRIEKLLNIADKHNLILCHENEEGIYGESPEKGLELLDHFGGRLRCVFDMGNFILKNYDPLKAYELLYNYIEYFHIKDGYSEGVITVPGDGDAKIKEIIKDFDSKNDVTYITLEPHLMGFVGLNNLTDSKLKHTKTFDSNKDAFDFAVKNLRDTLS